MLSTVASCVAIGAVNAGKAAPRTHHELIILLLDTCCCYSAGLVVVAIFSNGRRCHVEAVGQSIRQHYNICSIMPAGLLVLLINQTFEISTAYIVRHNFQHNCW
jgi:hypothetical protein